jgi:ketol-acid reductoisomerase
MESGKKRYSALLRAAQKHPIENVGRKLRARMRWKKKNKN